MRISVVDVFCGIGGLSYGFKQERLRVKAGIDSDESCRFAYETNLEAEFISTDIRKLSAARVKRAFDKNSYRVLIGCAPCTPFSHYTNRYRKESKSTKLPKWHLLNEFSRLVRAVRPHVVSMENVMRLRGHAVFKSFVRMLNDEGYVVSYDVVKAHHYGVPQRRSRLVLLATRLGDEICLIERTHAKPVTVRQAIGTLAKIKAGATAKDDRLHVSRRLSAKNLKRIQTTELGGSWQDWPKELQLACHKKAKGKSFRSVYGRMKWDEPAPVITTQCLGIGNGRFGHPEQDRAISLREAALIQTFPKKFKLVAPREPVYGLPIARQIGNAVPVRLGRVIARSIKRHIAAFDAVRLERARVRRKLLRAG